MRGYMDLVDTYRFNDSEERIQAFSDLAKQVPPLGLGAVNRLLSQTRRVAEQLLRKRKERLGDDDIKRIVDALASEIASHSHVIRRSEAREIGIAFAANAEDVGINDELLTLFEEYANMLQLEVPFNGQGELIAKDCEEMTWPGLQVGSHREHSWDRCFQERSSGHETTADSAPSEPQLAEPADRCSSVSRGFRSR